MPSREVRVAIIGDPSSLQRALRTADQGVSSFGSKMQRVGSRLRSVGSTMTRNLTLPLVGFGVLAARELAAGQRAMGQTEAVIESMGIAAQVSVDQIADMAQEMHELSGLDDEGLQEMLNTLLTFRNVVPIIDEAGEATHNLAAFFGGDFQTAATQVGRALNNPLRGITALTRRGVEFDESQRQAVEAMMAFGNVAGAQRIILQELRAEYGGQAEALGGTLTGRLNRLKNDMEEMGASILEDLLPALEDLAGILSGVADAYDRLTPTQQKIVAGVVAFAAVAGPLSSVLGVLSTAIGAVSTALGGMGAALGISGGAVTALIAALVLLGVEIYIIVTHWDELKRGAANALTNIINNVPGARTMVMALGQAVGFVRGAFDQVVGVVNSVIQYILNFSRLDPLGGPLLSGIQAIGSALNAVLNVAQNLVSTIASIASAVASIPSSIPSLPGVTNKLDAQRFIPTRGRSPGAGSTPITNGNDELARAIARELSKTVQPVVPVGAM